MKIAVIMIITFCCVALQAKSLFEVIACPEKIQKHDVSRYENRFKPLQNILPTHGVIGFISDCPLIKEDPGARMASAQYALAPLIIVNSADTPLVIGYFCGKATEKLRYDKFGLIPHMDLGNGVMLLRKETE